MKIDLTL